MDIAYEQIEVHSREMETNKRSNGNLRNKMKWGHNNGLDSEKKINDLADKSVEINQTKAQSEKIKSALLTSWFWDNMGIEHTGNCNHVKGGKLH